MMVDCLLVACDLCPRNSHWWGKDRSDQKVANPNKHDEDLKFPGIHGILQAVYPIIHAGSPASTQVNFGWECWQEKGCHSVGWQVPTGLWWPKETVYHCILAYADFTQPFKLHTNACGSGLGAVLYQTHECGMDAVIVYSSRSLTKAKSHYSTHKLKFLALRWAVVKKFHKYLYGLTFNVYTDNNPLTYIFIMAKLDVSLVNYNFWLYCQAGKTNVDADALSRVSWPGCVPDNSGTLSQFTAAAVWAVQEAALEGPTSPIEAYSCNMHVLDSVLDSQQVCLYDLGRLASSLAGRSNSEFGHF